MGDGGHPAAFLINILSVYNPAHLPHTPSSLICWLFFFFSQESIHSSRQTSLWNMAQFSQKLQPASADWTGPGEIIFINHASLLPHHFLHFHPLWVTSVKFAYKAITWLVLCHVIISFILLIQKKNMTSTVGIYRATRYQHPVIRAGFINKSRVINTSTVGTKRNWE